MNYETDMPATAQDAGATAPLQADLAKLHKMKVEYREAQNHADDLKGRHDAFEASLYDRMDEEDVLSLKTDAAQFVAKCTTYATITDMDLFTEWLKENGIEDEFIKDAPEKARINELVRERLDNGDSLPPGLSHYDRRYISITPNKN